MVSSSVRVAIIAITLTATFVAAFTWLHYNNANTNSSPSSSMASMSINEPKPMPSSPSSSNRASLDGRHNNGNGNGRVRTLSARNRTRPSADTLRGQLGARLTSSSSICPATTRTASSIPTSFDARTNWNGCISPILNQAACGSCWAFTVAQVMSDRLCISGKAAGRNVNRLLSPQQLVSCDHGCSNSAAQTGCDLGCSGGSLDTPWLYTTNTGLVGLSCLPYTSDDGVTGTCPALNDNNVPICSTTYSNTVFKSASCYQLTTVSSIQAEILTYGSVAAGMMAYEDFLTYESGIYTVTTTVQAGGHAVRIIGWGTSDTGVDYWLIANQWSEDWGMSGTAYIRRGTNEALIESTVVAGQVILPSTDEYESYATALSVDDSHNSGDHMHHVSSIIHTLIIATIALVASSMDLI